MGGSSKCILIPTERNSISSKTYSHRNSERDIHTLIFKYTFITYPLLGGLFFQSGIFIQALLIPVFFIWRAGYEYGSDVITSKMFGSDGMPVVNYIGVMMHEICLSVMITSIKHPLVFASLVLSDVLENTFCLWSLAKIQTRSNELFLKMKTRRRRRRWSHSRDAPPMLYH